MSCEFRRSVHSYVRGREAEGPNPSLPAVRPASASDCGGCPRAAAHGPTQPPSPDPTPKHAAPCRHIHLNYRSPCTLTRTGLAPRVREGRARAGGCSRMPEEKGRPWELAWAVGEGAILAT